MEEGLNHLPSEQETGSSIECNTCHMYFPFEDFQREHRVPLKSCILCRVSLRDRRKVAKDKKPDTTLPKSNKVGRPISKKNQDANTPQKRKYTSSQLPTHVCPDCRYSVCAGDRKICNACSRSKLYEKITQNELESKIKAISFDGPNINLVDVINSQEVETYEYKYVIDYIFDETITRLLKNGLLAKEVDRDSKQTNDYKEKPINQNQPSSIGDNPIPGSITLDNSQTISVNGVKYIDNFSDVTYKVLIEFVYNLFRERANRKLLIKSGKRQGTLVSFCFRCSYSLPKPPKTFHRVHLDCCGSGYIGYNYVTKVLSFNWKHKTHKMPKAKFKAKLKN